MKAAALAAAAILGGCASHPTGRDIVAASGKALAEAPLCCASLAAARTMPLPREEKPVDVEIGAQSQAFDFGGNKAFFVLYELPKFTETYAMVVTSVTAGSMQDSAVFIPRMATYDADFKLVRYFDEKTLRNRGTNLERTVFFNPQDKGERFLAIYGSDLSASIERAYSMMTVTPVFAGPLMFNIHGGVDGKTIVRSAPTGQLKLEVQWPDRPDRRSEPLSGPQDSGTR